MVSEIRGLDEAIASQKKVADKASKSGFLTSEFWLSVSTTVVGVLVKAGVFGAESAVAQAISPILIVAGPVIYILARSGIKKGGVQALALLLESMKKKEK